MALIGCATTPPPYIGQGPHPQITRGRPVAVVDVIGNIFALPAKLLFFNWRIGNHAISRETEEQLIRYVDLPASATDGTHFSLNEYAPGRSLKRLFRNKKVAWPYRLLLGLPTTVIFDVLLPGRLFAFLISSDYYNPYNDTVHIYSDLAPVAVHEAGHVDDLNRQRYKGTYSLVMSLPGLILVREYIATDEAIDHLVAIGERHEELSAYKILYPAMGSYVGGQVPLPGAQLVGILAGHVIGRTKAYERAKHYRRLDAANAAQAAPIPPPVSQAPAEAASPAPSAETAP